ncbi:peptidylprolyl isomerase [Chloroflexota bacterium]
MPKSKKKIDRVVEREASSKTTGGEQKGRRTALITAAVVIALILIVAVPFYYQSRMAPFKQPVLTVNNNVIDMGYYLKRVKLVGSDPITMLQQLANEQIIKLMAPTFGITVTPQEIDNALLYTASTENITSNVTDNYSGTYLTESEFKTWYRQRLNDNGLSDAEYKELTRTNLLATKLQQYLSQRVPTIAEQIHLNVIVVANSSDAANAKARIQSGESFADVASEVSLDTESKDQGGDIGWLPRGILPFDNTTFALSVGEVSDAMAVDPTAPGTSQYLLFMVSEKTDVREIDDTSLQVLRSRALSNWLLQEVPSHSIILNYDFNDSANQAWIEWQLSKIGR